MSNNVFNLTTYVPSNDFEVETIVIQSPPIKTQYKEGEAFDPTGMTIYASFKNGVAGIVTGWDYTPKVLSETDDKITITYANGTSSASVELSITVISIKVEIPYTESTFTYDGSSHSPTWVNYDPVSMTISGTQSAVNAGIYTVTFILKEGYKWKDGTIDPINKTWSITKASATLSLDNTSIVFEEGNTSSVTVNASGIGGALYVNITDTSVTTASISGSEIIISPGTALTGKTTIYVRRNASSNYNASNTVVISVSKKVTSTWIRTGVYKTAGTYTHTVKGAKIDVLIMSGGQGGGGGGSAYNDITTNGTKNSTGSGGGGGGVGNVETYQLSVIPNSSYTIVVGAGGKGGGTQTAPTSADSGTIGGTSSAFGKSVSCSYKSAGVGGYYGSISQPLDGGKGIGLTVGFAGSNGGATQAATRINFHENSYTMYPGGGGGGGSDSRASSRTSGGSYGSSYGSGGYGGYASNGGAGGKPSSNGSGGGGGGGGGIKYSETGSTYYLGGTGGNGGDGMVIVYETDGVITT